MSSEKGGGPRGEDAATALFSSPEGGDQGRRKDIDNPLCETGGKGKEGVYTRRRGLFLRAACQRTELRKKGGRVKTAANPYQKGGGSSSEQSGRETGQENIFNREEKK